LSSTTLKPQTTIKLDREELEVAIRAVLAEAEEGSVDQTDDGPREAITRARAESSVAIIQAAVETAAAAVSNASDLDAGTRAEDLAEARREARRERARREAAEKQRAEMAQLLMQEEILRKKIHEELMSLKGNIRVFCRVRPLLSAEAKAGLREATEGQNKQTLILRQQDRNGIVRKHKFKFDRVLDANVTQMQMYSDVAQLCVSVLDGSRVCIFAYGQTGSGKTYTMEGTNEDSDDSGGGSRTAGGSKGGDEGEGIVYRAVRQLCQNARERAAARAKQGIAKSASGWAIELSMYEVYNEAVCDLLQDVNTPAAGGAAVSALSAAGGAVGRAAGGAAGSPPGGAGEGFSTIGRSIGNNSPSRRPLSPTKSQSPSLKVQGGEACGLVSERCGSAQEVLQLLRRGHGRRATAATVLNTSGSSRSHMVTALRVVMGGGGGGGGNEDEDDNEEEETDDEEDDNKDEGEDGEEDVSRDEEEMEKGGCLHLIDLAGSERLAKSLPPPSRGSSSMGIGMGMAMGGPTAEEQAEHSSQQRQLLEAQHINKSLSSIGDVFTALLEKRAHVPYRNSKLTQLLQPVLSAKGSKVLMINCISPTSECASETLNSLLFASRISKFNLDGTEKAGSKAPGKAKSKKVKAKAKSKAESTKPSGTRSKGKNTKTTKEGTKGTSSSAHASATKRTATSKK
jgi:hypothetical protein